MGILRATSTKDSSSSLHNMAEGGSGSLLMFCQEWLGDSSHTPTSPTNTSAKMS